MAGPRRLPPSLAALAHGHFRTFAIGALISGSANWMLRLAQTLLLVDTTHGNASKVGLLAATQYLPILVFGTSVGVIADRRSKPLVLGWGQALMATAAIVQGVLVIGGRPGETSIFALAFCFGVGAAVDSTLRLSLAPEFVPAERVVNAVSLNTVSFQFGRLAGPALGGVLIAAFGFAPVFFIGATAFVVFDVLLIVLARRSTPLPRTSDDERGVRAGLEYARHDMQLMTVFVLVGMGGLVGPNLSTLATLMVHNVFAGGPAELGSVTAVLAVGTVAGAALTAHRTAFQLRDVGLATAAVGVTSAASALAPNPVSYAVLLVPAGIAALTMVTTASALIQTTVAPAFRGRITALYSIVLVIGVPVGSPLLGWLAEQIGVRGSIGIAGLVVLATAIAITAVVRGREPAAQNPSGSPA